MLISPAICLPNFWPISSTISIHSKSSLLTAVMISSNVGGFSIVRFDSMELLLYRFFPIGCGAVPNLRLPFPGILFCRSGTVFHYRKHWHARILRKSRFSRVYLPVYDDADSESPAYVDKDDVLFPFDASLHMFSIGHGPCVVVYTDWVPYFFIQHIWPKDALEKLNIL